MSQKTKIGAQTDVKTKVALSVGMVVALLVGAFFVNSVVRILFPTSFRGVVSACNSSYKLGDVDKNGAVASRDVQLVFNILLGRDSFNSYPCADLNNDGNVNAVDLQATINVLKQPLSSGYWPLSSITSISPTSGPAGTVVTIKGTNFGTSNATILFDNGAAGQITGVSSTGSTLIFPIASTATARAYAVSVKNIANNNITNAVTFTVTPTIIVTTTTSTVKTCNSSVVLGNVNPDKDLVINATDVQLVTNIYLGRAMLKDYPCADLNNDSKVDAFEITLMPICANSKSPCVGKYWPAK